MLARDISLRSKAFRMLHYCIFRSSMTRLSCAGKDFSVIENFINSVRLQYAHQVFLAGTDFVSQYYL
jgi:hypothetical protein